MLNFHLHYGVGVPSAYQTDLRGEKQKKKKKKKKKNRPKKGARGRFGPPPGSATALVVVVTILDVVAVLISSSEGEATQDLIKGKNLNFWTAHFLDPATHELVWINLYR